MNKIRHKINRGLTHPINIKDPLMRRVFESQRDSINQLKVRAEDDEKSLKDINNAKKDDPFQLVAGDNIKLRPLGGNKWKIYASGTNEVAETVADTAYTGPFAVVKKDANEVTVICLADDITYFQTAKIISGLTQQAMIANADVTITVTGYVYAVITYPTSAYVITYANAATIPAQDTTHIYISLARVTFASSAITAIYQEHDGQIYPTQHGRAGG